MVRSIRVYPYGPDMFTVYFHTDIGESSYWDVQEFIPHNQLQEVAMRWIVDKTDQIPLENPS